VSPDGPVIHVNQLELADEVSREDVERAVTAVLAAEDTTAAEISVTFVASPAIAELNRKHLDRPGPTDVIAFQLGEPDAPLGDIYICPESARESAQDYDVEPREELLRLVVHGTLHVLGYEHPEGPDREASEMFRRQEEILTHLFEGSR
jgi:probable rRNA maturation factor